MVDQKYWLNRKQYQIALIKEQLPTTLFRQSSLEQSWQSPKSKEEQLRFKSILLQIKQRITKSPERMKPKQDFYKSCSSAEGEESELLTRQAQVIAGPTQNSRLPCPSIDKILNAAGVILLLVIFGALYYLAGSDRIAVTTQSNEQLGLEGDAKTSADSKSAQTNELTTNIQKNELTTNIQKMPNDDQNLQKSSLNNNYQASKVQKPSVYLQNQNPQKTLLGQPQSSSELTNTFKPELDKLQESQSPSSEVLKHLVLTKQVLSTGKDQLETPLNPEQTSDFISKTRKVQNAAFEDILYPSKQFQRQRQSFRQNRMDFLKSRPRMASLQLVKYNFYDQSSDDIQQEEKDLAADWLRVLKKYQVGKFKKELPMCLLITSFNNNKKFRIELNLNSAFRQNYTNYKVVIIDDASSDGTAQVIDKYLKYFQFSQDRAIFKRNQKRLTALENIYIGVRNHCPNDSIVFNLDGDDQLIGRNVLQTFNAVYQKTEAVVVYSNFYFFNLGMKYLKGGMSKDYSRQVKSSNGYRREEQRFSHLRSFKSHIFRQIAQNDLKDKEGKFYTISYDFAMYYPMMELACGRVEYIDEHNYLYNIGTGQNDYELEQKRQFDIGNQILQKPVYPCSQAYQSKKYTAKQ